MTAVSLDGVWKRFGDFAAVSGLGFDVPEGLIYGVLGPNGAGKTTTLRIINDIIAADEGTITILDKYAPGREAAAEIGYLPEERGLYPKMRVGDTLTFFAELRGIRRADAKRLAGEWLERLGLSAWTGKRVNELSKGMQQKVQFASTFLHKPRLVILDEPWSGLDPINADVLRDVVLEQKRQGTTILFSTHLMEQAEKICDRVCIIAGGKRVAEGDVQEMKREAAKGLVAVEFASEQDLANGLAGPLSDSAVVSKYREKDGRATVDLAESVDPDTLLRALLDADLGIRLFERVEPSLHEIFVERVGDAAQARNPEQA